MSTNVEVQDAQNRLGELDHEAAGGADVVFTEAGVPMARLTPIPQPKSAARIPGLHPGIV
jgi:antitoxin (DNA-binding transcriptional repressor) of toxin-antitoxin stability system